MSKGVSDSESGSEGDAAKSEPGDTGGSAPESKSGSNATSVADDADAPSDDADAPSDDADAPSDDADAPSDDADAPSDDADAPSDDADAPSDDADAPSDDADAPSDDADAPSDDADAPSTSSAKDAASDPARAAANDSKKGSKLWWLLPVAVVFEFWVYGRNGYVDVCVGKEGETDFSLVGTERTDDNRWKFPRCETRLNLGLRSEFDAKAQEATKVACRGATLFKHRGEAAKCEAQEDGWIQQVEGRFCPPWDSNYTDHLFWFLK